MTTPSLTQGIRDNFDTGPLSWVMGEIRAALTRSKTAIHDAASQDSEAQSTALRQAKAFLHQAHGALQIVDVEGVGAVTETVEDLLSRLEAGALQLNGAVAQAIESACQAVIEYLEDLLGGERHQPVRLFPYLRSLAEVRGDGKVHPSDLFFPNLSIRPQLPVAESATHAVSYTALRSRFEKALLLFLKNADPKQELASAEAMGEIIGEVEAAQSTPQARGFWWVMRGFAEAASSGKLKGEMYVKQLFARINIQLRRMSEGIAAYDERLLRDALFFIASAKDPSSRLQQIRAIYDLEGQVPADYEQKRYGKIDSAAVAAAKEHLVHAKNAWNRIAGGEIAAAGAFAQEAQAVAEAIAKLGTEPLEKLLAEIKNIAQQVAQSLPAGGLSMEVATALLFIENALSHSSRLPEDFSERAEAVATRLRSALAGEQPAQAAQWLDEMSREAQQRQTLEVLAGEMQISLGQVEKMLDEFFGNPSKRSVLEPIDPILHQIAGALAVLDQDEAIQAIEHTQAAVKRFAEDWPDAVPGKHEFEHVARNIGALSFFIESLQLNSEDVKKRFSFDPETGVFQAEMLQSEPDTDAVFEVKVDPLSDERPAVLTEQAGRSAEDAPAAMPQPQPEPEAAEASIAMAASLLPPLEMEAVAISEAAAPDASEFEKELNLAQMEIGMFAQADESGLAERPEDTIAMPASQVAAAGGTPAFGAPMPETDEAIDAELLEIFLAEAEEVLDCVRQTLPKLRNESHNQEHMTTLRRSFHTLKGSGRMVGLTAFGEAAWSIEQVLNLRLSEGQGGSPELYALLEYAAELLGAWVADLQIQGSSDRDPAPLVSAAERVKKGEAYYLDQERPGTALAAEREGLRNQSEIASVDADNAAASEMDLGLPQVEEMPMSDAELETFHLAGNAPVSEASEELESIAGDLPDSDSSGPTPATVIDFPEPQPAESKVDDSIKRIGTLEISVPLHNIYLTETDELVRLLAHDLAEWRHEPEREVNVLAVHAAHSLAGSSATVGFDALQEVAHALEMVLQTLSRSPVRLEESEYDALDQSVICMKAMLQKFALCEMPPHEPVQVQNLKRLLKEVLERAEAPPPVIHSAVPAFDGAELPEAGALVQEAATADGDAGFSLHAQADEDSLAEESLFERVHIAASSVAAKDELDADLLPVFLEEGSDILPQMGQLLRAWQQDPKDAAPAQSLLRLLHTIKGSARMAGAMRMGQHMHEIESRIEQISCIGAPSREAIEDLQARLDLGLQLFDRLLHPGAGGAAADSAPIEQLAAQQEKLPAPDGTAPADAQPVVLAPLMPVVPGKLSAVPSVSEVQKESGAMPSAPVPLVRVRADILDRLVNQAGEVSISRSRVETEVDTLRQSLSELTENVARLRGQLREIEIQAESQMASQMAHAIDREFDPLEFDRFTRLQELTRMMAESVNDVASVQHNLSRTIDGATIGLTAQARLTRDLQQDLMRVRMVQFASISERLYRVTRQASKELDKRVNLDIRGGSVEMDRSVLEKMAGPFEHLLRNAIVHGIESRADRLAAGKSEVGELLVEIRQEGNEVLIQFSDDGQGLHLPRIREKALSTGLLTDDTVMSDNELTDLIFHPGFSTAQEVTELAGRGVGMDVVRSEAAALGGRVSVLSEPGRGARFLIQLPLTLAVTQVVLISTGGKTYAVPSVLVEQVQQLKANALAAAYNDGAVMWQDSKVPLYYLSALLGDTAAVPLAQQYSPLVILKSGNDRVALHVDTVVGNREVVVKNIGPQLARMIGIAGATVLGSGDIVLIIDPVPLAQRAIQDNARAPRLLPADAPNDMGAVAEMAVSSPAMPSAQPVQGLRTQHIVMVVDDSLTVRRVTQRFLAREGYQVVLAKDGVDALEQLQAITPDVMLVDIEMPRMDGFDLTRNIRSDERTGHIPIIMITSRTATKHRNYALELGVNEYLGKPYQESELLRLVAGFVGKESISV